MHSKSDNIEIMSNNKADEFVAETFQLFLSRYQIGSETSFAFDCVHLLYYKYHKINLNRCGSYGDSPNWMKSKKATINPINKNIINAFNML